MSESVFEKLEEIYPKIIAMMPGNVFNTHEFMIKLTEAYQGLYVQALIECSQNDQPSQMVIGQIADRLKKRSDLVTCIGIESVENVFEKSHDFEVWQKV